jgi:hypothetical protein
MASGRGGNTDGGRRNEKPDDKSARPLLVMKSDDSLDEWPSLDFF